MDNTGYCLAYRRAWNHEAFNDLLEAAIWNFLYQNAFYEDGERTFNGVVYHVRRGQIVTTPRFLAKGFRISESNARRVIQKLIKLKTIKTQTTTKATIITICNYDKFQLPLKTNEDQNDEQTTNKRRTNDANNNKENKNNENNEIIKDNVIGEFEEFWNAYGKIGNKQQALKSFKKIKKEGISYETIIGGLAKYQEYCRAIGQEQRYIKHASTWLNNKGWEDEYAIYEQSTSKGKSESQRAREAIALGLGLE